MNTGLRLRGGHTYHAGREHEDWLVLVLMSKSSLYFPPIEVDSNQDPRWAPKPCIPLYVPVPGMFYNGNILVLIIMFIRNGV